jgi:hypothetical protein
MDFVCTFQTGAMEEARRECGNRAAYMVVWPPSLSKRTTMTYCRMHFRAVEETGIVTQSDEVTVLAGAYGA